MKNIQIRKNEEKLSLLLNIRVVFIEILLNLQRDIRNKNEFSKVVGYKINTQIALVFLYSNKQRILESNHIYSCIKNNKVHGNKFIQGDERHIH